MADQIVVDKAYVPLTFDERQKFIQETMNRKLKLMEDKGREYCKNNPDCNFNFTEVTKRLGMGQCGKPEYAVGVYMTKALMSIEKWFQDGQLSSGESIHSRIDDAINYLFILDSIVTARENGPSK